MYTEYKLVIFSIVELTTFKQVFTKLGCYCTNGYIYILTLTFLQHPHILREVKWVMFHCSEMP